VRIGNQARERLGRVANLMKKKRHGKPPCEEIT
jgi:hypothetical protein